MRRPGLGLLTLAVALAGCPAPVTPPAGAGAVASRKPAPAPSGPLTGLTAPRPTGSGQPGPVVLPAAALAGEVRVLVGAGRIISDNGGGVVSNNSGALVVTNSAGVVANNGAGYRLRQAAAPRALALADARVVACDAAGQPLRGADGAELAVTTDAQGRYRFEALPGQGVVLRVALATKGVLAGGVLQAIAPRDRQAGGEVAIDTTSSLGAAYVLGEYITSQPNPQATLDRLPSAAADRLSAELRSAAGTLADAPAYEPAALTSLVAGLRGQAAALDQALEAIRALLLGQLGGGDGRPADRVAIAGPRGLVRLTDGRLIIGERSFGRIRVVAPDGKVGTYADALRGDLKQNFPAMADLAGAPDGTLYVVSGFRIWKIDPQQRATVFAGGADGTPGALDVPATGTTMAPSALAVGPDGTLYVGEQRHRSGDPGPARVLAIGPDGIVRRVPYDPGDQAPGRISALHVGRDGTLYVLRWSLGVGGKVFAYKPGAAPVLRYEGRMDDSYGGLAEAPDGGLYVGLFDQLIRLAPDGTRQVLAGRDGPAALKGKLRVADSLLLEPDGTLLIGDAYFNVVHALRPDGTLGIRAGTTSAVAGGGGLDDIALAAPGGVAFGPDGRLAIAPRDGRELELFKDGTITAFLGPDTPAAIGAAGYPSGLVYRGDDLYVLDEGNHRILKVAADGQVTKLVGHGPAVGPNGLDPGERRAADAFPAKGTALAIDAQGRLYWVGVETRQVYRLATDGMVAAVAGKPFRRAAGQLGEATLAEILATEIGDGGPAADATLVQPNGLAFDLNGDLLVTDAGNGTIRRITGLDGPRPMIQRLYGRTTGEFYAMAADADQLDRGTDPAQVPFYSPFAIAIAPNGDRYISELGTVALGLLVTTAQTMPAELLALLPKRYARVRRITPAGRITTVAGPGSRYFNDPTGPDALITPMALAIGADGRLAICDNAANLVRILPAGTF